jgi:hypothetical protein
LISDNEPALVCKEAQRYQRRKELARHDWHSRAEIVEAARRVMGEIHLDPTSSEVANRIIKAKRFYMVKEDALSQPWADRVWLNPPYGRFAPRFVEPKIGTADVKL